MSYSNTTATTARRTSRALAGASLLALLWAQSASAQVNPSDVDVDDGDDEIVVIGTRQVIQDSIALKRQSVQIVDGLSADEIGDIPALSIGEALENITGVASHRENGGATEVSVRGLGPYLSSTVINGRAATNGSGDRSVNFSQFPSELLNKLAVFKTQDASQIEGGVAGQIQLETLRPLDFGKDRLQIEIKGEANPDQFNQDDSRAGDVGHRLTGSYVNQFDLGGLGEFGFSIGAQTSDLSQPEAESRQTGPSSNSRPACLITEGLPQYIDETNGGTFTGFSGNPETRDRGDDDCDDFNDRRNPDNEDTRGSDTEGYDVTIDPETGLAIDSGTPIAFAPSQRGFRQNDTRDQRDAIFGALQWQPNSRLDINLDGQYSVRKVTELRNDITFNGGRRNDSDLAGRPGGFTTTADSLILTPQGGILRSVSENTIEIGGGDFEREETYYGGGLNVSYDVNDRLTLSGDLGYSNTERTEFNREFRIQSDITPIIEFDRRDSGGVNTFRLYDDDFDVTDPTNFVDRLRVRVDNDVFRDNEIFSGRFDAAYAMESGFLTSMRAGVRLAEQNYLELPGGADSGNPLSPSLGRFSFEIENDGELTVNNREVIDDANEDANPRIQAIGEALEDRLVNIIGFTNRACSTPFGESDFLSSTRTRDLISVIGDDGRTLSSTNSWATFDAGCVADVSSTALNAILAEINAYLLDPDETEGSFEGALNPFSSSIPDLVEQSIRTVDVQEQTAAFYAMADYEVELGGMPLSGNFGARVVQTDVTATGYRPEINITNNDGELTASFGDLEAVTEDNSYTRVLPSVIGILEITPDTLLRGGIFRAMSRPDPADMGFGRSLRIENDEDNPPTSLDELIGQTVGADGNPSLEPLMSWNFDLGVEYYPNDDTILALAGYYKSFQGGFINTRQAEDFTINGQSISRTVDVVQTSDETSDLFGIEVTATHAFTYLPGLLSGLGAKLSYNYVDSNFEFEDSRYGDAFQQDVDGTIIQVAEGVIAPGNLPGLSENTISATAYYTAGDFDFQVNYKYRDDYFQPFISDGTRLRYVGDVGVWEARASYYLDDNFRLSVEAINLGSEPKEQFAFVSDDLYELNDYGPRIFFGLRGRF